MNGLFVLFCWDWGGRKGREGKEGEGRRYPLWGCAADEARRTMDGLRVLLSGEVTRSRKDEREEALDMPTEGSAAGFSRVVLNDSPEPMHTHTHTHIN